ncbi:MAG: M16 family metallopeptidase [Pyrinomonadaceae bacterium]
MKKTFLSVLLTLSILTNLSFAQTAKPKQAEAKNAATAATAPTKQAGIEVPFVSKTLSNGFEIIVLPDKSVPIVTVEIAARNGSFTESPELNGLSHLYEHMFFKPHKGELLYRCEIAQQNKYTDYLSKANCDETFKLRSSIGNIAYLNDDDQLNIKNAQTREEVVNYYFTTTASYLESAMKYINDAIRYPTFDENELKEEIRVVIGEIDRNESNPFFYLQKELNEKLFYKYPTRKQPLGTRETVTSASVEKMKLIQSRYYVPNNTALVVTGDVEPQKVFEMSEKIFGSWAKRDPAPFTDKETALVEHPPLEKSAGYFVAQPVQNVLLQIGWHGPSIGKDDAATYAADVFSYIISQPNSRFQRAMIDSGLAVDAQIGYYTQRNVGPIIVTLVTTPDKAKAALKAVYAEIEQFDTPKYFTNEELESAKTILESRDLFEREQLSEYAHTLSFWWSSTGIDYFRGYHRALRATTRSEINKYIDTYIQGKPHVGIALLSSGAKTESGLTEDDLIGK